MRYILTATVTLEVEAPNESAAQLTVLTHAQSGIPSLDAPNSDWIKSVNTDITSCEERDVCQGSIYPEVEEGNNMRKLFETYT